MRWNVQVAALSGVAVLLLAPLAGQAHTSRMQEPPPPDPAATTVDVPADQPPGQVVTIMVPADPSESAPPKPAKAKPAKASAPVTPAPAPAPAPVAPAPPPVSARSKTAPTRPRPAASRGGRSAPVAVPPAARGGPSFAVAIPRERPSASASQGPLAAAPATAARASRLPGWMPAALGLAVFAEALLVVRLIRRRPSAQRVRLVGRDPLEGPRGP